MAAIVATNVVRMTINGTYLGAAADNVLDYYVFDDDIGVSRPDQVHAAVAVVVSAWADHMASLMNEGYVAHSLSYVDLDTLDGITGETATGSGTNFPASGGGTGEPYAAQVAMLVKKGIDSQRGQRSGRIFMAGIEEDNIHGNTLDPAFVTAASAGAAAFLEATTETATLATTKYYPIVLHVPGGVVTGHSQVHSLLVETQVATQKRRNKRV